MKTNMIQIVVNPAAGSGKAKQVAHDLHQKLKSIADYDFNLTYTIDKNDALFITRKAISDGASMIVAVGGDGTINEVVNGFFIEGHPINPSCELGIVNCGTGGGYARTLNIPKSTEQQIGLLFQPGSAELDLGQIRYHDNYGITVSRLFVNECQVGIGSDVAAGVGKKSKFFGGKIAFGVAATALAILMKPLKLELGFDDEAIQEFRLIGLVVGNGTECAGGMKLTPGAKLNDGLFDVLAIHEMSVVQRLFNLSKVYSGKHILSPHFTIKRCKKLKIRSGIIISLEADGEMLGNSPFDIEIIPAAIRVKTGTNKI